MEKAKKTPFYIIIIMVLAVVFLLIVFLIPFVFNFIHRGEISNFKTCKDDFKYVSEYLIDYKNESEITGNAGFYLSKKNDTMILSYKLQNLNVKEKDSDIFEKVWKAKNYDSGSYSYISVYQDKYVVFTGEGLYYGLAYSKDGKKPEGLINNSNYKTIVKRIDKNWYIVSYI